MPQIRFVSYLIFSKSEYMLEIALGLLLILPCSGAWEVHPFISEYQVETGLCSLLGISHATRK